jgi:hypothetical protein
MQESPVAGNPVLRQLPTCSVALPVSSQSGKVFQLSGDGSGVKEIVTFAYPFVISGNWTNDTSVWNPEGIVGLTPASTNVHPKPALSSGTFETNVACDVVLPVRGSGAPGKHPPFTDESEAEAIPSPA